MNKEVFIGQMAELLKPKNQDLIDFIPKLDIDEEQVDKEFIDPIKLQIIGQPIECKVCQVNFSLHSIEERKRIANQTSCPSCKSGEGRTIQQNYQPSNRIIQNYLFKIKVHCTVCKTDYKYEQVMVRHSQECQKKMISCQDVTKCMKKYQKVVKHYNKCISTPVPCILNCNTMISSEQIEDHYDICPNATLQCQNQNCHEEYKRKFRHNHLCPFDVINCEKCHCQVLRKDLEQHVKDVCPLTPIPCDQCHEQVIRQEMFLHIKDICDYSLIACVQCSTEFFRKDKHDHKCLKSLLQKIKDQEVTYKEQMATYEEKMAAQEEEIADQKEKMSTQEQQMATMQEQINNLIGMIQAPSSCQHTWTLGCQSKGRKCLKCSSIENFRYHK